METESIPELPPEAEAKLQALIAEQNQRRCDEDGARRERRQLWLSHHWSGEYDRCTIIAGRHVCRRCLVLYPIALTVLAVSFFGLQPWPENLDPWFIWLLSIPATLEFLAEKLRDVSYNPTRQVVVTVLVALAVGRGFAHEFDDQWSWLFWGPVLVFGGIWFAAAVTKVQRSMFQDALEASIQASRETSPEDNDHRHNHN